MSPTDTESPNSSLPPFQNATQSPSFSNPQRPSAEGSTDSAILDFRLPNIRRMFIPDPGMVIVDADLAGADAQVVAWEADDSKLKQAFREGKSVHLMNGEDLLGAEFTTSQGHHKDPGTPKGRMYDALKRFVHATNYLGTARTLHLNPAIAWPLYLCEQRQHRWFDLHPGIRVWHKRVADSLRATRSIRNQFGYRIIYFDRIDSVLSQAVAWGPQSTVAEVCFRGALQLRAAVPWVELLLQVHDSIVFQIPNHRWGEASTLDLFRRHLAVPVPYPDPLVISWGIAGSEKSWGDCK